ncbi:MAG TPA: GAF domain-containing sensor histidine kinase, partial [Thermoleophilia bacterium]|nr:GAF domain-containing sensor histidine kinase [Thermoleophilia bacterium]
LRRRVEELDALQHLAQILAARSSLDEVMDETMDAIARLFKGQYACVTIRHDPDAEEAGAERDGWDGTSGIHAEAHSPLAELHRAACEECLREGGLVTGALAEWPGLTDRLRRQAGEQGISDLLAQPLIGTSGPAGALLVARPAAAGRFTDEDRRLSGTIGEALAAVLEIDRLHQRETLQAAVRERQALARDLHDAVTQSIYSAALIAEALPAVYERDPQESLRHLEHLRRLVRAALAEMRTLLFELRPSALEQAPLDTLLARLGDALAGQADLRVEIAVEEGLKLPGDVKLVLYRVTQEAFSNIVKHARATWAAARVASSDGALTLTVSDDGRGFDPSAVPSGHLGLQFMTERLERLGGSLVVQSAPGEGTTLQATCLLSSSDGDAMERMGA